MSQRNLLSCTMIEASGSSDDMFMYIYCVALYHIAGCSHQVCCYMCLNVDNLNYACRV